MGRGLSRQNFVEGKGKQLRFKKSSLAIEINTDEDFDCEFYIFDRRTRCILGWYKVINNWIKQIDNLDPIKYKGKKK